ncbi:MAG: MoaD/ThiS family protein [bacterium]
MSLFGKQERICVEAKVMGVLGGNYVSVVTALSLARGATVKTMLKALLEGGHVDETTYAAVKSLKPPLRILINGEDATGRGRRAGLAHGDTVSIFTPLAGG